MKKANWILMLLLPLLIGSGCVVEIDDDASDDDDNFGNCLFGEDDPVIEILNIDNFDGIKLKIDADVFITQGSEQKVEITAEQNIIDEIERDVDNGTWEIEFDQCVARYDDIQIIIEMENIELLSVSGSGFIRGENIFNVDDIDLRISGSGDIDVGLDASSIEGEITGSGKMFLEGNTEDFDFDIAGSGDYRAFDLNADKGDIKVTGSGDSEVRVNDELDIRITGSGDVRYKGFPTLDVEVTGSGRVIDAN